MKTWSDVRGRSRAWVRLVSYDMTKRIANSVGTITFSESGIVETPRPELSLSSTMCKTWWGPPSINGTTKDESACGGSGGMRPRGPSNGATTWAARDMNINRHGTHGKKMAARNDESPSSESVFLERPLVQHYHKKRGQCVRVSPRSRAHCLHQAGQTHLHAPPSVKMLHVLENNIHMEVIRAHITVLLQSVRTWW